MLWWCKARAVVALAISVVATLAMGSLVGDAELPIPALTGRSGTFLVGHLITLMPALILLYGIGRNDIGPERVSVRFMRGLDVALAAAVVFAAVAIGIAFEFMGASDLIWMLVRNTSGYVGLALLFYATLGHRLAGVILTAVPLFCAAAGWGQGNRPEPWAWPLHQADSSTAFILSAFACLLGTAFMFFRKEPLVRMEI